MLGKLLLLAFWSPPTSSFPQCGVPLGAVRSRGSVVVFADATDGDSLPVDGATTRRNALARVALAAPACLCCRPAPACALARLAPPPPESLDLYDLPRNALKDAAFAQGMAVGMGDYEREAFPAKRRLFERLFAELERVPEPAIVEVGIGSFPNAPYYTRRLTGQGGLDVIGVDPNDRMEGYARDSAAKAGMTSGRGANSNSFRIVHGVSEALPLDDSSCDAVVCSLTLCSVVDPARSVAEIKRVLRPGGKFMFWEHVLSQTDPVLAQKQVDLTPAQVQRADGCHLDRKTGDTIREAGFRSLNMEYLELKNFGFLNPTVCGIATA